MTRVAIMQPTYLPWLGYFGLMNSVDLFIFLDTVQFTKRSWQQRNQIKTAAGASWLTIPVLSKGKRDQLITDVDIDRTRDFPQSHVRAIELNYKKAAHFGEHFVSVTEFLGGGEAGLAALTTHAILSMKDTLGITTAVKRSSDFKGVGSKADLLASICEEVRATEYISPPGSREYLDESDAFSKRGIAVKYFEYKHPEYQQCFGPFLPYMSVIDLLMNCGPASLGIIESGCGVEA